MIKVLAICHGNICRSPMCEFILKDMIRKMGRRTSFISSPAPPARRKSGGLCIRARSVSLMRWGFPTSAVGQGSLRDRIMISLIICSVWMSGTSATSCDHQKRPGKEGAYASRVCGRAEGDCRSVVHRQF